MDFNDYSKQLAQIASAIDAELARRRIDAAIEQLIMGWKPSPSERDAAVSRAAGLGWQTPDGRPQFYIPDLGE